MANPDTIVGQLTVASYVILGLIIVAIVGHYWREHRRNAGRSREED